MRWVRVAGVLRHVQAAGEGSRREAGRPGEDGGYWRLGAPYHELIYHSAAANLTLPW